MENFWTALAAPGVTLGSDLIYIGSGLALVIGIAALWFIFFRKGDE